MRVETRDTNTRGYNRGHNRASVTNSKLDLGFERVIMDTRAPKLPAFVWCSYVNCLADARNVFVICKHVRSNSKNMNIYVHDSPNMPVSRNSHSLLAARHCLRSNTHETSSPIARREVYTDDFSYLILDCVRGSKGCKSCKIGWGSDLAQNAKPA